MTNFYLGLSSHSVFCSASAVVFQDCVTWRDFVYFSRENLDITGFFFPPFSFFFWILRPRENSVSAPREKLFFEDWVTARITWTIYAHHVGNSVPRGRWSFDFRAKGHPSRPAPAFFSFRPMRANNCNERWTRFFLFELFSFISKKFNSRWMSFW